MFRLFQTTQRLTVLWAGCGPRWLSRFSFEPKRDDLPRICGKTRDFSGTPNVYEGNARKRADKSRR